MQVSLRRFDRPQASGLASIVAADRQSALVGDCGLTNYRPLAWLAPGKKLNSERGNDVLLISLKYIEY